MVAMIPCSFAIQFTEQWLRRSDVLGQNWEAIREHRTTQPVGPSAVGGQPPYSSLCGRGCRPERYRPLQP